MCPVIAQFQNASPFQSESVDRDFFLNLDTYNNILGYEKSLDLINTKPEHKNVAFFLKLFHISS